MPPDDPQGFDEPPSAVCSCERDDSPACCTTQATGPFATCNCGDGVVDSCAATNSSDECDGADLAGQSCLSLGYTSGTLRCADTCHFDVSRCEDCVVQGPVSACAHPFDDHNDVRLLALGASSNELAVAFVTGTSTDNGYSGDTSVRFALLDADLVVIRSVAVPLPYASTLSLAATVDGWLLLVERLNYVGFDAPPNGVLHTLLSFDSAGDLRGTIEFHERRDGFLIPRAGGEPLYVFASDHGTTTVWGQSLSYGATTDAVPFNFWRWRPSVLVPGCGVAVDDGFRVAARYGAAESEGYFFGEMLLDGETFSDSEFQTIEPGNCGLGSDVGNTMIYQARSPGADVAATFRAVWPWYFSNLLGADGGRVPAYRVVPYENGGGGTLVLRATEAELGATELELWSVTPSGSIASTTALARGSHTPSYDMVRFGNEAIAAWVGQAAGTALGRVALARIALGAS